MSLCIVFFFKQKTAYEMRISDWSSDVCSSDLHIKSCRDAFQTAFAQLKTQSPQTSRSTSEIDYLKEPIIVYFDFDKADLDAAARQKIGRASCRERVCQYV